MQKFDGSPGWQSNVYGAYAAGLAGVPVLSIYVYIFATAMRRPETIILVSGFITYLVIIFLTMFPGNLIAFYPYAVELEEGKGLCILAPLKRLYVPFENIKDVQWSWLYIGWRVKLRHRQGLLSGFVVKKAFGARGRELISAIEREVEVG